MGKAADFGQFMAGNPTWEDFITRGIHKTNYGPQKPSQSAADLLVTYLAPARGFGGTASALGLGTLNQILAGQGKTDPRQMNLDLADISRTTQNQQQDLRGQMAGMGFERSGLGAAVNAAIGQSGAERRSRRISEETQLAEQRKRDDLGLLLDLIVNPGQQAYATTQGVALNQQERSDKKKASQVALLGSLIGALAGCWVARRIYGADNPKWLAARHYMLTMAPAPLRDFYLERGESIAASMTDEDAEMLRPHFDRMALLAIGG